MRRATALAATAVLAGLLLLLAWQLTPSPSQTAATPGLAAARAVSDTPADRRVVSDAAARKPAAAPTPRTDSLRGSAVDGQVQLDASGRLVADRALRRLFDYFLTRLGERSPAQIRADLLAWLQDQPQLDAAARTEALRLFDRYVELLHASAALGKSGDLAQDLERLRALRVREFGAELARAWFGDEEDQAAATLQRLALARDGGLDPAQRAQRLAELEAQQPAAERAARADSTDFQLAVAQSEQLAASAATPAQRAQQRTELWGEEASARLAELDEEEASWQLRLSAYALAREQVLAEAGLDPAQRERRLQGLLAGFSEAERRRVLSLAEAGLLPH